MRRTPEGTRRAAIVLAALAVVLSLSGCFAEDEPAPTTPPVPTATPVFATEEEALAAAEEAYANYLRVSDEILLDGGDRPERLRDYATADMYELQADGFSEMKEENLHAVGETTFDSIRFQSFQSNSLDEVTGVVVYLCTDYSRIDILNADGDSVVLPDRVERTSDEVTFQVGNNTLLTASVDYWSGDNFCEK